MKKNLLAITFLIFTLLIISTSSYSQQDEKHKKSPEEFATKMATKMKEKLSLSDEQYKQVYDLALSKAQSRMNNKETFKTMDKETRKQQMKQGREDFKKQLDGILNTEQRDKLQQMKSTHKHHKGDKKNKGEKKKKELE